MAPPPEGHLEGQRLRVELASQLGHAAAGALGHPRALDVVRVEQPHLIPRSRGRPHPTVQL